MAQEAPQHEISTTTTPLNSKANVVQDTGLPTYVCHDNGSWLILNGDKLIWHNYKDESLSDYAISDATSDPQKGIFCFPDGRKLIKIQNDSFQCKNTDNILIDRIWSRVNVSLPNVSDLIYVVVIGQTGTGKSSLIQLLTKRIIVSIPDPVNATQNTIDTDSKQDVIDGKSSNSATKAALSNSNGLASGSAHSSNSNTKNIKFYRVLPNPGSNDTKLEQNTNYKYAFVDTMGTDDTSNTMSTSEILNKIHRQLYQNRAKLIKIVWLVNCNNKSVPTLQNEAKFIQKLGQTLSTNNNNNNSNNNNINNIWDGVIMIVKEPQSGHIIRRSAKGSTNAAYEYGCPSDHWKPNKNIFGYTNIDWISDPNDKEDLLEVYKDDQDKIHRVYTSKELEPKLFSVINNIIPFSTKFIIMQCSKCGHIGDPRFSNDVKCHALSPYIKHHRNKHPKFDHIGNIKNKKIKRHFGDLKRIHFGNPPDLYYHPKQAVWGHKGDTIITTGGKIALGLVATGSALLTGGAATCATVGPIAYAIGTLQWFGKTGMTEYTCCGKDGTTSGCQYIHNCCNKIRGQQGCTQKPRSQLIMSCCNKNIDAPGCKIIRECCGKSPHSEGCIVACDKCKDNINSNGRNCGFVWECCNTAGILGTGAGDSNYNNKENGVDVVPKDKVYKYKCCVTRCSWYKCKKKIFVKNPNDYSPGCLSCESYYGQPPLARHEWKML